MNDTVACDQLIYGWAGSGSGRGYQTVAMSPGIAQNDRHFIEQNSMPVSFMPGDFDECIRKFILPSGNIAVSFVKNAGRDELGRSGAYYSHFISIPWNLYSAVDMESLMKSFISDPEEAGYILRSFTREIIPLPQLFPSKAKSSAKSKSVRIFASPEDLSAFLSGISSGSVPVILSVPDAGSSEGVFRGVSAILSILPSIYSGTSIATFTSSILDESHLLKIFILPAKMAEKQSARYPEATLFESGRLASNAHFIVDPVFRELGEIMWNEDASTLKKISGGFDSLPDHMNLKDRFTYALEEYRFRVAGDAEGAIYLMEHAPTSAKEDEYYGHLRPMIAQGDIFRRIGDIYLSRLQGASAGEVNRIVDESLSLLKGNPDQALLYRYLSDLVETFSSLGDTFPYLKVFDILTDNEGNFHGALSPFLCGSKAAFRKFVSDFLPSGNRYKKFSQISGIVLSENNEKKRLDMLWAIFSRGLAAYDIGNRIEFAESFIESSLFDTSLSFDLLKEIAKQSKKSSDEEIRKKLNVLSERLIAKGLNERNTAKLRKMVEIS